MAEKLVGPRCVQIVSKRLVSQTHRAQYCEMFSALVFGYTVCFKINRTLKIPAFSHLFEVDSSETHLMTSAEKAFRSLQI